MPPPNKFFRVNDFMSMLVASPCAFFLAVECGGGFQTFKFSHNALLHLTEHSSNWVVQKKFKICVCTKGDTNLPPPKKKKNSPGANGFISIFGE